MHNDNPIEQFFYSIPPITRTYLLLSTVVSTLVTFNILTAYELYLNFQLIRVGEWWRLFTNFLFFDKFSLSYIFYAYFLYFYCRRLEEHAYHNKRAEFLTMLLFGALLMLIAAYFFKFLFLSQAMTTMILYVWSRKNPTEQLRFYGLIWIKASYLPFVLLLLSIFLRQKISSDILGIAVGHIYYYLTVVLPVTFQLNIEFAPRFLKKFFGEDHSDETRAVDEIQLGDEEAWNINHDD